MKVGRLVVRNFLMSETVTGTKEMFSLTGWHEIWRFPTSLSFRVFGFIFFITSYSVTNDRTIKAIFSKSKVTS